MTTAKEFFPGNYDQLGPADRSRLDELAAITTSLQSTSVIGMQNNVRVRLSHFNFFMPYFFGLKNPDPSDTYVKDHDQLRNMWSACCGSLQHDVDVVADPVFDQPGAEVLFVFPSYWDSSMLNVNPAMLHGESFDAQRRRMESELNFPNHAVDQYLTTTHKRVDSAIGPGPSLASLTRRQQLYDAIRVHYGLPVATPASQQGPGGQGALGMNSVPNPYGDF